MNALRSLLLATGYLAWSLAAAEAPGIVTTRIALPYDETLVELKAAIAERGYNVAKLQRVGNALRKIEYETDDYSVVHFARLAENDRWISSHPELIAYLPLRFTLAAEGDETLLIWLDPLLLDTLFAIPGLRTQVEIWSADMRWVAAQVRAQWLPEAR